MPCHVSLGIVHTWHGSSFPAAATAAAAAAAPCVKEGSLDQRRVAGVAVASCVVAETEHVLTGLARPGYHFQLSSTPAHFNMAHRQSGSYKEEPGVSVAVPGDHVSLYSLYPRA